MTDAIMHDSIEVCSADNKNAKSTIESIDCSGAISASGACAFFIDCKANYIQLTDNFLNICSLNNRKSNTDHCVISIDDFESFIHSDDIDDFQEAIYSFKNKIIDVFFVVCRLKHNNGGYHWLEFSGGCVKKQANGISGIIRDVTAAKEYENELKQHAFHDQLTGLANRVLMNERINQAIRYCKRYKDRLSALVFLDLNDMKDINDSYGHAGGDELLINVANRLKGVVRGVDTVARFGGDEFVIVLQGIEGPPDVILFVERLLDEVTIPMVISGRQVKIDVSIGIKIFDHNDKNKTKIMREADLALYQAKIKHKSNYVLYDKSMHKNAEGDVKSSSSISKAIDNDEFCMYYQPIIDIGNNKIVGIEALMRWDSPEFGLISPDNFISIAEKSTLIEKLGKIALEKSCAMLSVLRKDIPCADDWFLSVNVSKRQLENFSSFKRKLLSVTKNHKISPTSLHLELTEYILMDTPEKMQKLIKELKDTGVHLSIDDFGTGYSSLSHLHLYPFDVLKIDRTFVAGKGDSERAISTIRMINELAKNLHMQVIVEGIETCEELSMLDGMENIFVQGFKFSRPINEEQLLCFAKDFKQQCNS